MKHIAQSLTLGLAVLAATASAPKAADWAVGSGGAIKDFGSIKDYRNAAVPVPAPRPALFEGPAEYYIRGDIGWNVATSVDATATGGGTSRTGDDLGGFMFGSVGGGRYITPSLRGEVSFDFRPKKAVTTGSQYFKASIQQTGVPNGLNNATTDHMTYAVTQTDNSSTRDHNIFFNLYHDFRSESRITPYIGAGIGIDFKTFKRDYSQSAVCSSAYNQDNVTSVSTPYGAGACPAAVQKVTGFNSSHYVSDFNLAAAVMVGASFKVSHGISIDTGYRLIWEGATATATGDGINGPTSIKISDRFDHELHTGVRVDLN